MQGITYENLSSWSGYSLRSLEAKFHQILTQGPPVVEIPPLDKEETYLLIDALWFGKRFCLMLYRHSKSKIILYASVLSREFGSLITKDLKILKSRYRFSGIVSDGGTGIRNAVFKVFGHIPHQICLAHLHRDVINAIGRFPKDQRVKKLKRLANHIWLIESKEALFWWEGKLKDWTDKNRDFLREYRLDVDGHWWFIHKGVKKAVRILVSLPDTSFKFLDYPLMPKTTNELEGSISLISRKHNLHKGLKRERVKSFLKWFIYFYNRRLLSQRKT
ncbi:transposase [Candidatus Gottesmanbacteria bacterium]|nr:transposase [Candidatus Gottesmanbacteria bacterium]